MCGTNGGIAAPNNILEDGNAIGTLSGGFGGAPRDLGINLLSSPLPTEVSDWQLSYVVIWQIALSQAQLHSTSAELQDYLATGAEPDF